jgi:hypothetical protein
MKISDWVGIIGVTILLLAFFLNLANRLNKDSYTYVLMNIAGAGIACVASMMIRYTPFVVLEGCWTLASIFALIRLFRSR